MAKITSFMDSFKRKDKSTGKKLLISLLEGIVLLTFFVHVQSTTNFVHRARILDMFKYRTLV